MELIVLAVAEVIRLKVVGEAETHVVLVVSGVVEDGNDFLQVDIFPHDITLCYWEMVGLKQSYIK